MISIHPIRLNLFSLRNLAYRLNFPIKQIDNIIERKAAYVTVFEQTQNRKGRIKTRTFHNPKPIYKTLLRKINKELLAKSKLPEGVCGGVLGNSLVNMVRVHCSKEAVYKIDLSDFFPNIELGRIFKFLLLLGCSKTVAIKLAELTTYNNRLPQGYPTSPMLANMIAFKLDIEHQNIARKYDLYRTRWIDDIVFSGRIKDLERAIPAINSAVKKNNFILNLGKIDFVRRDEEPEVTGLLVNKHKPYIPNEIVSKIRDLLLFVLEFGVSCAKETFEEDFKNRNMEKSLDGKINWISGYNKAEALELRELFNNIVW